MRFTAVILFAFFGTLRLADPAAGDILPLTDVFAVHEPTIEPQSSPDVLALPGDEFSVTWTTRISGPSGADFHIVERTFAGSGLPKCEQRLLSAPPAPDSGNDQDISVIRFSGGRRAAVWTSTSGRDGDADGIFGVILNSSLKRLDDEFQANLRYTGGLQRHPTIAGGARSFLVAWTDFGDDRDAPQAVYAQRFTRGGRRLGEELPVAVFPHEYAARPSAAALFEESGPQYIVAYESVGQPENGVGYDIAARLLDDEGVLSRRIALTNLPARDDGVPSVATAPGGFIVTWTGFDEFGADVYLQRFTNAATVAGPEIRANTYTKGVQSGSDLAVSTNGSTVVIWSSRDPDDPTQSQDGDGFGLYGQAFAADGLQIGAEFQVSTRSFGEQGATENTADIGFINDTDFVVVWQESFWTGDSSVHARIFRLDANRRLCGDTVGQDLTIDVTDALGVLRASVALQTCDLCSCDIDGSGEISVPDAQKALRLAVSLHDASNCPACAT